MGIVVGRRRDLLMVVGALAVCLAMVATPAHAQDERPRFTSPENLSEVVVGEAFVSAGAGCTPGEDIVVSSVAFDDVPATVRDDGRFFTTATVETWPPDDPDLDGDQREISIATTCAGEQISVPVTVSLPDEVNDGGPRITSPPSQTSITEGVPLTVEGVNCAANSEVQLRGPLVDIVTTTTADGNGDFSVDVLLPVGVIQQPPPEVEERWEATIAGTCGGSERFSVVVVIELAEHTGQVAQIPVGGVQTGAGGTAADDGIASWMVLGSTLAAAAAMVAAWWWRRAAGLPAR